MNKINSSERGQVLILVALALVALLGFTALAIDGSMMYSDRRFGQNGADAATLAGGGEAAQGFEDSNITTANWSCGSTDITDAVQIALDMAVQRAQDNGFVISNEGTTIPDEIPDGFDGYAAAFCSDSGGTGNYMDVHIAINVKSNTSFVHMFYGGEVSQRVNSVTRIRPRAPFAFGQAIVALNPNACSGQKTGFQTHGTADIVVNGGGIFSNGCMRGSGGPKVDVYTAGITYVGQLYNDDCDNFYVDDVNVCPSQTDQSMPPEAYAIAPPDCSDDDANNVTGAFIEGYYKANSAPLPAGLYCVTGGIKVTNDKNPIVGYGVTIVMLNGSFEFSGGWIELTAPLEGASPAIPGVLFYAPTSNTTTWKLNGNSSSHIQGVVLIPGVDLELEGNGVQDTYQTQIIAWNVEAGGTSNLFVTYDDAVKSALPTYINLWR